MVSAKLHTCTHALYSGTEEKRVEYNVIAAQFFHSEVIVLRAKSCRLRWKGRFSQLNGGDVKY